MREGTKNQGFLICGSQPLCGSSKLYTRVAYQIAYISGECGEARVMRLKAEGTHIEVSVNLRDSS